MDISKGFFVMGALWLCLGIALGIHMGASQDFTLAPVHAHINLLGFVLMTVFGLAYRLIPALTGSGLARAHFWLHQVCTAVTLVGLFLLLSGIWPGVAPLMALAEVGVLLGILFWTWNVIRSL